MPVIPPTCTFRRAAAAAACGLVAAGAAAGSAQAADPGLTCRASAVRTLSVSGVPSEPLAANRSGTRCADDTVGAEDLGAAGTEQLGLDGAFAATATNGAAVPAAQRVEARSAAAGIDVPGTEAALRAEGVSTVVTASCAGGVPQLAGESTVARLTLAGQELPTDDVVEQVLGGVAGLPVGAVLRIVPGEESRSGAGGDAALTRRALHVTIAQDGETFLDAVIGEASAGTADAACTTTTAPGSGDTGASGLGGFPVAGQPFGGGRAVTLAGLSAFGIPAGHPCRNRRFGGNVALVGTRSRDRISGSNAADRMFGLALRDRLDGAIGRDCVAGGAGNDRLSGALGNDLLRGDRGNDQLDGGPGTDRLVGGRGADVINPGYGRDRVRAGRGNDFVNVAIRGKRQVVDCGPGRDTVRLNFNDRQRRCERVLRLR